MHTAAEAFSLPLRGAGVRAHGGDLAASGGALSIEPPAVQMSSLAALEGRVECRVYNPTDAAVDARLVARSPLEVRGPAKIGLLGDRVEEVPSHDGTIELPLRPHEIATVRLA